MINTMQREPCAGDFIEVHGIVFPGRDVWHEALVLAVDSSKIAVQLIAGPDKGKLMMLQLADCNQAWRHVVTSGD